MNRKKIKKIVAMIFVFSLILYNIASFCDFSALKVQAQAEKEYIIVTESQGVMQEISEDYDVEMIVHKDKDAVKQSMAISSMTEEEADELKKQPDVLSVEQDTVVKANRVKNGRRMIRQKEKKNSSWNMEMIKQNKIVRSKKNSSAKIRVAILDSGVDYANDIEIEKSLDLVSDDETTPLFLDITGHGSSVAGIIAAKDNGEGITGINPDVLLYSVKVLDDNNTAPISRVVEGIYWAMEQDVDIINISFGTSTKSIALEKAIQDAYHKGILIIAAAGNTGNAIEYPAAYEEVMSVGAVNGDGETSDFSPSGKELEIVAPGEKIESTGGFGGTVVCSGTSMAAPHVVGVASLIWQKDPDVSNEFIRALLKASANSYGDGDSYGNGLLDANKALEIYEDFKAEYEETHDLDEAIDAMEENTDDVAVFDTNSYVEGRWTYSKHNEMIVNPGGLSTSDISILKTGATYPDAEVSGVKGLGSYPEWHGGYKCNNYIASYIYVTSLARAIQNNTEINTVYTPGVIGSTEKSHLLGAVTGINWNEVLATPSNQNKSLFVWGMAIHTATDVFAHSAWADVYCTIDKRTQWEHLDHGTHNGKADDPDSKPKRYETAALVARSSIKKYINGGIGTVDEFLPEGGYVNAGANWTIKGLSDNARSLGCGSAIFNKLYYYTEAPQYHSYYSSHK